MKIFFFLISAIYLEYHTEIPHRNFNEMVYMNNKSLTVLATVFSDEIDLF